MTILIKPKPAVISGILLLLYVSALGDLSEIQEFDSKVTRSTFKLQSGNAIGTGFVLLQPDRTDTNRFGFILITAAHVLAGMPSSNLTMFVRCKEGNSFRKQEHQLPIRAYGTNLWTQHSKADVAVMRIRFPSNADLGNLLTILLATDKTFEEMAIHPGDELRVYGDPYGFRSKRNRLSDFTKWEDPVFL